MTQKWKSTNESKGKKTV